MNGRDRVIIPIDGFSDLISWVDQLTALDVLVGIPSTTANQGRQNDEPNNAELGYIHENGSPAANIPARPWLVPGVVKAEPDVMPHLEAAGNAAIVGDMAKARNQLMAAGMVAAAGARLEIETGQFVPLADSTVAQRRFSRQTQSMRPEELRYFQLRDQGMDEKSAQNAVGIQPLLNTGGMRNAVTSVVRQRPK